MSSFFSRRYIQTLVAIIVVGGIFMVGFYFGKRSVPLPDQAVDLSPFWKTWNVINDKFVSTVGTSTAHVSDQTRVYGAISGMVDSLGDPYTVFFPPVENKSFSEEISGNFEGVGMEVDKKDGVLIVISPLKGSPASQAGIKTGDKILKINDTLTSGLTTEQAVSLIRGKAGTAVKLTIARSGIKDPFVVSVTRQIINMPTVDTEVKGDVFVIRLYTFSAISPNLFRDALRDFVQSGKTRLVIDLRGNPGGYLEAAIDMASWFLPAGKTVVKEDFRNATDAQVYRSKGYNVFNSNLRLAILIDGGSASASEILAGALHDNGLATLVGTQSFGKGSVQELVNITSDTSLKVTVARWLTPNGISISHQGITPDVVVPLDQKQFAKGTDIQLNKAIEILDK